MDQADNQNLEEDLREIPTDEYTSGEDYREKMENLQPSKPEGITWKQKLAVGFLAVFAGSAMILWLVQFKNNLAVNKPLPADITGGSQVLPQGQDKNIDTDGDGLSDYDELNYYNTSPYLEDTDSDGIGDKREIEMGEDPNCPKGQNCFSGDESGIDSEMPADKTPEFDVEGFQQYLEQSEGVGANEDVERQQMEDVLKGEVEADDLRALLEQFGMSEELLGQISDEDLMGTYNETLKK